MPANTTHTIKIMTWIRGVLEVIEVQKIFTSYKAARGFAQEYADKAHHPAFKLKIYNYLGESVFTLEESATPELETYA